MINRTFIEDYVSVLAQNDKQVKTLIYVHGPIITLINDQGDDFVNYKSVFRQIKFRWNSN